MEQELQLFLDFLKNEYRYSDNTVAAYRNDLNQFHRFVQDNTDITNWSEVTPEIINDYISDLNEIGAIHH